MSVLLVKLRRPTLASRFLSEQVGVRQASQIGFSKPPFSESLVDGYSQSFMLDLSIDRNKMLLP